jgi:hypothetical protein
MRYIDGRNAWLDSHVTVSLACARFVTSKNQRGPETANPL